MAGRHTDRNGYRMSLAHSHRDGGLFGTDSTGLLDGVMQNRGYMTKMMDSVGMVHCVECFCLTREILKKNGP